MSHFYDSWQERLSHPNIKDFEILFWVGPKYENAKKYSLIQRTRKSYSDILVFS